MRETNRHQRMKKRIAALLVAALVLQTGAGAIYAAEIPEDVVEETTEIVAEEDGGIDTAEDASVQEVSENESAAEEASVSEDTVSADELEADEMTADEVPFEEVSENSTVSADAASARREFIEDRIRAINEILEKRLETMPVMAVLYLCDTYPLRSEPSYDAETVADIECGSTLYLKSASFNEAEYWFEATVYMNDEEVTGYIPMKMFVCVDEEFVAWSETLSDMPDVPEEAAADEAIEAYGNAESYEINAEQQAKDAIYQFPNHYRDDLLKLWQKHPKWVFVPQNTGVSLEDAVSAEYGDKSWIGNSAQSDYKDRAASQSGWSIASKKAIRYYMNPVNFFSEKRMFMFEQQTYNKSNHTKAGVQSVLNGTFMSGALDSSRTYADVFMTVANDTNVSPYHQASRVLIEQGRDGTSGIISGKYPGYEGYYNYYNIKASGSTTAQIITRGLTYAKEKGWNTRYKALKGGAQFLADNYITRGQDTIYLEKFNVTTTNRYNHQYMQNIQAPFAESAKTYEQYSGSGALNNAFIFKIPVYTGGEYADWETADKNAIKEALKVDLYALTNVQPYLKNVSLASMKAKLTDGVTVSWKVPSTTIKAKAGQDTVEYTVVFNKPYCLPKEYKVPVHVTTYSTLSFADITNQMDLGYLKPVNVIQGNRKAVFEVKGTIIGYCPKNWKDAFSMEFKAGLSGRLKDGTSPVIIISQEDRTISENTPPELRWILTVGVPAEKAGTLTKNSTGQLTLSIGYEKGGKLYSRIDRKLTMTYINTAPVVDMTKATVNAWKQEGTKVSILSQNGVSVDKVTLTYRGAESSVFAINGSDGNWYLELTDEARKQLKETGKGITQKLTLTAKAANGETATKTVTAVASVTKPAVTFKQLTKPNLYYTKDTDAAKAGYIVTAGAPIESISTNTAAASAIEETGRPYFGVEDFDSATRLMSLNARGLDLLNTGKIYRKAPAIVKLSGYDPIPYVISVKTVNTKPSVKAASGIIYGDMETAYLRLTGAALPADVTLSENDIFMEAAILPAEKAIRVRALEGFRPGKKKFILTSEEWRAPVTVSAKVSKAAAPAIKLSTKKAVLNSSLSLAKNGSYDVTAMASGGDMGVILTSILPANEKSRTVLDQGYLKAEISGNRLSLGLIPEKRGIIKAGTYTFVVEGVPEGATPELTAAGMKPAKISVTISDKAPTSLYTLKASGKINLVNRAGSYVAYTPTIKSLCASSVSAVEIGEVGGEYFTAELIKKGDRFPSGAKNTKTAGTILLRAKPGVTMSKGMKYTVQIVSTLNNGLVVRKTVKVKPVQSPKKTRGRVSALTIPINGAAGIYTIASAGSTASDSAIEKVELVADKNGQLFDYTPITVTDPRTATGTLRVNKNIQKLGKYTLKFKVTYKDHALNVKPSVLKLKVTVR